MKDGEKSGDQITDNSLLIYPAAGLIRLYCPIHARCIQETKIHKVGDQVSIHGITYTRRHPLLYLIEGRLYAHHHFRILNSKTK